jgi:cysteine desulfurase family protein
MIYLDNAATSWPKPEAVYQAMDGSMRRGVGNPGRSAHDLSIASGRVINDTRESMAQLLGVDNPDRIVFTKNATEALNLVIKGLLRPGDHVITSGMEHNSVIRPLRAMERRGVELTVVSCTSEGLLDPQQVERALRPNTRLIILNHASNVVGTILPVAEVAEIARRHEVILCVDAAQTLGALPFDIAAMKVDLVAFTGHKSLLGPQGTGGLYIREGLESALDPLEEGGTGSRSEHQYQPDFLPDKYESGTSNTVGLAGLGAGLQEVLDQGVSSVRSKEEKLTQILIDSLDTIPGLTLHGTKDAADRIAVISFSIEGVTPSEVAMCLEDDYGIMCRPGLQCAPLAHRTMGTFPEGTVRLSLGYFTTEQEISFTVDAVEKIAHEAQRGRRWA